MYRTAVFNMGPDQFSMDAEETGQITEIDEEEKVLDDLAKSQEDAYAEMRKEDEETNAEFHELVETERRLRTSEEEILDSEVDLIKEERAQIANRHELLLLKRASPDSPKRSSTSNEDFIPRRRSKEMPKSAFDHSDHSHLHVAFDANMPHLHELPIKPSEDASTASPAQSDNSDGASSASTRGSDAEEDRIVDMGDSSDSPSLDGAPKDCRVIEDGALFDSPIKQSMEEQISPGMIDQDTANNATQESEQSPPEFSKMDGHLDTPFDLQEDEPPKHLRPVSDNKIQHAFHNSRPFQAEVWRYESLALWADEMRAGETCEGVNPEDVNLSFHDFVVATSSLLIFMEERDARAAKRFRRHFSLVTEMYSETLWPALKIYDIYIRFQHQGVTSLDLTTFDPLLFGSILTEGQDDFLTRIRPASVTQILPPKIPDMASYPDESFECPPISFEGPLSGGEEASLLEPPNNTTLCSFMDDLYAGLGCHAQAFVNAGVVSEHMLIELAVLPGTALADFVKEVAKDRDDMSLLHRSVMVSELKNRYGNA